MKMGSKMVKVGIATWAAVLRTWSGGLAVLGVVLDTVSSGILMFPGAIHADGSRQPGPIVPVVSASMVPARL